MEAEAADGEFAGWWEYGWGEGEVWGEYGEWLYFDDDHLSVAGLSQGGSIFTHYWKRKPK